MKTVDKADAWLAAAIKLSAVACEMLDITPAGCPTHERWKHIMKVVVPGLKRRSEIIRNKVKKT